MNPCFPAGLSQYQGFPQEPGFSASGAGELPAGGGARRSGSEWYQYQAEGTIPAGAGTGAVTLSLQIEPDSYFIVRKLIATFDGDFSTQIQDTGASNLLMDAAVRQPNLWGTAQQPNYLLDPIVFSPSSVIRFLLTNQQAGANIVQLILEGEKHYDLANPPFLRGSNLARPMSGRLSWFQYTVTPTAAVAANATPSFTIPIDADSFFVVRKLLSRQTGIFEARISDTAGKGAWQRDFTRNANVFGTVNFPNILKKPRLLHPNSIVNFELRELSGAPNTIQIVLEGVKQYR